MVKLVLGLCPKLSPLVSLDIETEFEQKFIKLIVHVPQQQRAADLYMRDQSLQ